MYFVAVGIEEVFDCLLDGHIFVLGSCFVLAHARFDDLIHKLVAYTPVTRTVEPPVVSVRRDGFPKDD